MAINIIIVVNFFLNRVLKEKLLKSYRKTYTQLHFLLLILAMIICLGIRIGWISSYARLRLKFRNSRGYLGYLNLTLTPRPKQHKLP